MVSIKITVSILFMLSVNATSDGARDLVRSDQLMGVSPPLMLIYSHSRLRKQYKLASP